MECALEISNALQGTSGAAAAHGNPQRAGQRRSRCEWSLQYSGSRNQHGAASDGLRGRRHILLSKHVAEDLEQYGHWKRHLHDLGECEVKHGVRVPVVNLYTEELGNPEVPQKFRQARQKRRLQQRRETEPSRGWIIAAAVDHHCRADYRCDSLVAAFCSRRDRPAHDRAAFRMRSDSCSRIPEKSIAVLPFENLSEDKANAYFADGIQDEILTRLAKIADLKVISRTSTQHYKSAPENLPEIAKQLGVAHILEGSVQKSGDSVRVNVQLIKAANDSHLWADTFDRKLTDIFSVESEVAKAIAEQLRAKLTGQEEQVIAAKPTDNPEAYDAYLRGLAYTLKTANTPANSLGAQKYLREAVRLDPKFALAWALLSYTDASGYLTQNLQPTVALREEARQAAETALTLQPNLGEAVLAKGYYHYACLKDYDTAVRYFEQARPLLPNSSRIPESLAYVARRRGQWDRSEAYFNEAERLDPRNVYLLTQHALSYIVLRRFPEALRKLDQVLNITPDDVDTLVLKGELSHKPRAICRGLLRSSLRCIRTPTTPAPWKHKFTKRSWSAALHQSISRLKEILAKPDPALGYINGELRFWLGWAQEVAGDHAAAQESWRQARSELEPFLKEQPENYGLIGDLALTNMGLGDKAAALAFVEKAMAASPDRERRARWSCCDRDPRPRGGADGRARPRHRRFTETTLDTVRWRAWLRACRSLPRCSGSIRCSIRSGMIRASKNSPSRKHRNKGSRIMQVPTVIQRIGGSLIRV